MLFSDLLFLLIEYTDRKILLIGSFTDSEKSLLFKTSVLSIQFCYQFFAMTTFFKVRLKWIIVVNKKITSVINEWIQVFASW